MADSSMTLCTPLLNQLSMPRVTRTPKKSAMISAGTTAAAANSATKRRCSRAPALSARSATRRTSRQPISAPSARISPKLTPSRVSTNGLAGPIGPARVGDEPSPTASAVRAADTA